MLKRIFDLVFSFVWLIILSPVFILIAIIIKSGSKGPVFYKQVRVGLNNKDFNIYKFRTMYTGSDKKGLLTVGGNDNRITKAGLTLRKYKLDEIPQLINVFNGTMSFVGPRPEVRKYVNLYSNEQKKILTVKPGITDPASIAYSNENELLLHAADPEKEYIEHIMPEKLRLNLDYINNNNLFYDLKMIFQTIRKIISH
jgi:lipopolysaccharide/colanic/teichoic acid biosynthesis glycosyltransferase